jgi:nucleotide-binding universal stress UspA family protein
MLPIKRILHPTDFSDRSDNAFQVACALARDHNASLVVLHVVAPQVLYSEGFSSAEPATGKLPRMRLRSVQAYDPAVKLEHHLAEGNPAAEILRVARETGCDLIVLGTHGWSGLGRMLMGSVAEEVVRKAHCPVLTVKTPFPAAGMRLVPKAEPTHA